MNNKHEFNINKLITKEELLDVFERITRIQQNSQTLPANILLLMLKTAKNKKDVKSIERQYKHIKFIGGKAVMDQIQEEYKRLGIN